MAYAGTVLWAITGIIANQYGASAFTTTVAALCAVLTVAFLIATRASGTNLVGGRAVSE